MPEGLGPNPEEMGVGEDEGEEPEWLKKQRERDERYTQLHITANEKRSALEDAMARGVSQEEIARLRQEAEAARDEADEFSRPKKNQA